MFRLLQAQCPGPALRTDEGGDEIIGWMLNNFTGAAYLELLCAGRQNHYLVSQQEGLVNIVGNKDNGLVEFSLESKQFFLQLGANDRVNRAEGLIHEQDVRVRGKCPGDTDSLLLASRELVRIAVGLRRN